MNTNTNHQVHIVTPTFDSVALAEKFGFDSVALKMEAFQPSGSFKMRGIGALMSALMARGNVTHFISSSGGNAGVTAALIGRQLGVKVTVFVPETTKEHVIATIKLQKAAVVVSGASWDDTNRAALAEVANDPTAAFVHPFDDPHIWRGHASIVSELVGQTSVPDAIVLSVGGGGLLCGVVQGLQAAAPAWRNVPVVAVETHGAASFNASLRAGQLVTLDRITTVATTLGARRVCSRALELSREHKVVSVLVSDEEAIEGARALATFHRTLVEPACGAAVAALPLVREALVGVDVKRVVVIVCGGAGGRADFCF
jgi:L-serine/L-threonine ammonia-lyase